MVVIEIIGSEGKTPRFEKTDRPLIRVGRALDNDIIIDDPYIDGHHLSIDVSDPDTWQAIDLDSENGTIKGRNRIRTATLSSGDELVLGKTSIRIFRTNHNVPAARSLRDLEHLLLSFDSIPVMIGLMATLAALPCIALYLNAAGNRIQLDALAAVAVSGVASSLGVTTIFALISRLLRGESRFRVLFNITMASVLVSGIVGDVISVIYYNLPGAPGKEIGVLVFNVAVLGVYVYVVLLLTTRLQSLVNKVIAAVMVLGSIGTYAINEFSERDSFHRFPRYDGTLYAPVFLLRGGESPEKFRAALPGVFDEADEIAREEKSADLEG